RGPETPKDDRAGRRLDAIIWGLNIVGLIVVAAGVAYYLSHAEFKFPEFRSRDDRVETRLNRVRVSERPTGEADLAAPGVGAGTGPVRWVRPPGPEFPERAARRGIAEGAVVLACRAPPSGRMGACAILEETPPDAGFGEAALASMADARVSPREADAGDAAVRFTIRFQLAD